jgi:nucleotide-binding universal stress UspA family protein
MYHRILVPIDGSATAQRGLQHAIALARQSATPLLLLHVVTDFPRMRELMSSASLDDMETHRRGEAQRMLEQCARLAHQDGVAAEMRVLIATETAAETIVHTATTQGCDLIVLGTHGRSGLPRAVLGSVAEGVSRHSPLPVLLVPPAHEAA